MTNGGAEVVFTSRSIKNLTTFGGIASITAEICTINTPADTVDCSPRSGLPVPFTPELNNSLMAVYVIPLQRVNIIINGSFVHTDEQVAILPNNDGSQNPTVVLSEYDIINASVGLSFDDDRYRASLIGKNLADARYVIANSGDRFRYQFARDTERYFSA